jgi:hypothetical protein
LETKIQSKCTNQLETSPNSNNYDFFYAGRKLLGVIELTFFHFYFSIVPTAFFFTTLIFVCFTLSALWAEERSYLYLGG